MLMASSIHTTTLTCTKVKLTKLYKPVLEEDMAPAAEKSKSRCLNASHRPAHAHILSQFADVHSQEPNSKILKQSTDM